MLENVAGVFDRLGVSLFAGQPAVLVQPQPGFRRVQRIRQSINERLHLRLWATPLRHRGLPVWIGQVSRDIGVRFTWRTWNLTTHRIDPDVDEARDYVVEDLLRAERLELAGYVEGVGGCDEHSPRKNLTGDRYFTDGRRAAVLLSPSRTAPKFIAWT